MVSNATSPGMRDDAHKYFIKLGKEHLDAIRAFYEAKSNGADESEIQQLQQAVDQKTQEAETAHLEMKVEEMKNRESFDTNDSEASIAAMM